MIILNELSTLEEYAKMCDVTTKTIIYRHNKGSLASIEIDGYIFVDSKASPPEKFLSYHNKRRVHPIRLPDNLNPKDFVSIISYSERKKVRGHNYYGLAIMNKIQSVAIGNIVFILKSEAAQISIKHKNPRFK